MQETAIPPPQKKPAQETNKTIPPLPSADKKSAVIRALEPKTLLQYLKGVGPKLAEVFAKKNIHTVQDLIHWYPRTYRDQRVINDFAKLVPGTHITLYGYVTQKKSFRLRTGKTLYEMVIKTKAGWIACKYFRLPFRGYFDGLQIDQKVKAVGKVSFYRDQPTLIHPDVYPFKEQEEAEELVPVYTEMEKISQQKIRKMMNTAFLALKQSADFLNSDPLPLWLREENHLITRISALEKIHKPDQEKAEEYLQFRSPAQKRLIFEEFFFLQLYMGMKNAGLKKEHTHSIAPVSSLSDKLKSSLPFELTTAQERTLKEIARDMQESHPMHRLIQGDVGCGKTIAALLASCPVMENGLQCAIMAPTEILAEQHYKNAQALLKPLGIHVSLLTGKTRARQKKDILEKLLTGYSLLCVGTHALIQEAVRFKKLSLVIIDEQHRFGAHQRALLKEKGAFPHFLVMTATPIPRSLAMTLYGDLSVSIIDEMPKGRQKVITKKTFASKKNKVLDFAESLIRKGRQAYIVYPLVEESEHIDLKNATEEYEKLKKRFTDFKLGLLHGKMPFYEKQEIMSEFAKGNIQILVSTTVIEVGVDVANACLMIVEHAERFGLSQLHQLRGRVGRGKHKSYCVLIISGGFSIDASSRLSIMEQTSDGFKIAEADLEIRGPGEFLGSRQSGLPEFRVAHLIRDGKLLKQARASALKMIKKDPDLSLPEHKLLKKEIQTLSTRLLPG